MHGHGDPATHRAEAVVQRHWHADSSVRLENEEIKESKLGKKNKLCNEKTLSKNTVVYNRISSSLV